jgi:hypothetical protein
MALDVGWKQYRRDVEWQCRWLELRMKEVSGHVNRYERMLEGIERAKTRTATAAAAAAAGGDVVGAATLPASASGSGGDEQQKSVGADEATGEEAMDVDGGNAAVIGGAGAQTRMKRRRQHEGERAPAPVLITHPLFSPSMLAVPETTEAGGGGAGAAAGARLDRGGEGGTNGMHGIVGGTGNGNGAGKGAGKGSHQAMTPAEKRKRKKAEAAEAAAAVAAAAAARGSGSDSDLSTAALYEQIEVLQQRVTALHQRLGQPAPSMHATGSVTVVRAPPKPAATKVKSQPPTPNPQPLNPKP